LAAQTATIFRNCHHCIFKTRLQAVFYGTTRNPKDLVRHIADLKSKAESLTGIFVTIILVTRRNRKSFNFSAVWMIGLGFRPFRSVNERSDGINALWTALA